MTQKLSPHLNWWYATETCRPKWWEAWYKKPYQKEQIINCGNNSQNYQDRYYKQTRNIATNYHKQVPTKIGLGKRERRSGKSL